MFDQMSPKLIMTTLFVIHGVFMIAECGLCKPVYTGLVTKLINIFMECQI